MWCVSKLQLLVVTLVDVVMMLVTWSTFRRHTVKLIPGILP